MVLVYVTNVQVKMNMFRKGCMLFYFAKTIEFACELRKHCSFLFTPFLEDFSAAQPFLLQQVNNQLVRDFLSQQNTRRFFFLSLWIYLWLAETSQQPINQTTWEGHPPL